MLVLLSTLSQMILLKCHCFREVSYGIADFDFLAGPLKLQEMHVKWIGYISQEAPFALRLISLKKQLRHWRYLLSYVLKPRGKLYFSKILLKRFSVILIINLVSDVSNKNDHNNESTVVMLLIYTVDKLSFDCKLWFLGRSETLIYFLKLQNTCKFNGLFFSGEAGQSICSPVNISSV